MHKAGVGEKFLKGRIAQLMGLLHQLQAPQINIGPQLEPILFKPKFSGATAPILSFTSFWDKSNFLIRSSSYITSDKMGGSVHRHPLGGRAAPLTEITSRNEKILPEKLNIFFPLMVDVHHHHLVNQSLFLDPQVSTFSSGVLVLWIFSLLL